MKPVIYKSSEICKDVRVALDQNAVSTQLLDVGDNDTLTLDELILSKIVDAVRIVETNAPTNMLDSGYNFGDALSWGDMFNGWTLLPDDFMRLIVFKMSDWERPVYTAIDDSNVDYLKQSSRTKGIRGTTEKPVCAIVLRPEGRTLEFWSCNSTNVTVERAVYLPLPKIDTNGGVEICERCYRPSIYYCAALVAQAIGDDNAAKTLMELSKTMIK